MSRRQWVAPGAILLILIGAAPVWAGQAEPEVSGGGRLMEFLWQAGVIGWIIIGLSVVVLGLLIEYMVTLRRSRLMPEDLLHELSDPVENGDRDEAIRLCEESPGFLTNVMATGLAHLNLGAVQAGQAMQDVRDEETVKLFSRIGWLKLIADVSPMLGLLGTVWGMMRAVRDYAGEGTTTATFAHEGIGLALITTLLGLVVAIIATSIYFFFQTRVTRLSLEVGEAAEQMVQRIARHAATHAVKPAAKQS